MRFGIRAFRLVLSSLLLLLLLCAVDQRDVPTDRSFVGVSPVGAYPKFAPGT